MSTRLLLITGVLTALSALAIFVVPHHAYPEHTYKPRTLWEIVKPVFAGDLPPRAGALMALFALMLLGTFAALYPIALVPMTLSALAAETASETVPYVHRSWLIGGGVVALLGAAVNLFVILVSEMSFGWGVSSSATNRTPGFVAIPLFHAIVALLSLVIGASPAAARLASHIMSP